MGIRPHAAVAPGRERGQIGYEPPILAEEFLGAVARHPRLQHRQMLRFPGRLRQRHLMRAKRTLNPEPVDNGGPGPPFRRSQHDHRPPRTLGNAAFSRVLLDALDHGDGVVARRRHLLVHRLRLITCYKSGSVAVAHEQARNFVVGHTGEHGRPRDRARRRGGVLEARPRRGRD